MTTDRIYCEVALLPNIPVVWTKRKNVSQNGHTGTSTTALACRVPSVLLFPSRSKIIIITCWPCLTQDPDLRYNLRQHDQSAMTPNVQAAAERRVKNRAPGVIECSPGSRGNLAATVKIKRIYLFPSGAEKPLWYPKCYVTGRAFVCRICLLGLPCIHHPVDLLVHRPDVSQRLVKSENTR